jgi:hypothetical protein
MKSRNTNGLIRSLIESPGLTMRRMKPCCCPRVLASMRRLFMNPPERRERQPGLPR